MRISLVFGVLGLALIGCAADGGSLEAPSSAGRKTADDGSSDGTKSDGANQTTSTTPDAKVSPGAPVKGNANADQADDAKPDLKADAPVKDDPPAQDGKVPLLAMNMSLNPKTGDWLMSRSASELAGAGYTFNGIQYRIFEAPPAGAQVQPLYRCTDKAGTHFQSNDFNCEGFTREALLGYVYINDPGNGAKEITRCIGATGIPIVSTTRIADCDPFIVQGGLGFAFDADITEAAP